jgi:hypothetical protein
MTAPFPGFGSLPLVSLHGAFRPTGHDKQGHRGTVPWVPATLYQPVTNLYSQHSFTLPEPRNLFLVLALLISHHLAWQRSPSDAACGKRLSLQICSLTIPSRLGAERCIPCVAIDASHLSRYLWMSTKYCTKTQRTLSGSKQSIPDHKPNLKRAPYHSAGRIIDLV